MKKHLKTFVSFALLSLLVFLGAPALGAQAFGFGDSEGEPEGAAAGAGPASIGSVVGGELSFSFLGFPEELFDGNFTNSTVLPAAALFLNASGSKVEAHVALKLDEDLLVNRPGDILDEAWLRIFSGQTIIQGGLMRLTWGRADSLSVLDILNPKDSSDLTLRDEQERKIPVPMLRVNQGLGAGLTAELAYLPWFEGNRIAMSGPWVASQMKPFVSATFNTPATKSFDYGQAGLRLNASLSGFDLGTQYFYGRLTTPYIDTTDAAMYLLGVPGTTIDLGYNPYHQIGADAAFVLGGFNLRLEAGINLTEDSAGTDPLVYNQHIVWSAGFDRDLFAGINLNFQSSGKVRLRHDKITSPLDIESGTDITSTQLAALLSRPFLRDRLKVELLGILGAEKLDYMIEPGLVLSVGDAEIALRGRYFGGDSAGELGQFNDKSYISLSSKYKF
jgi:hypothetical protein